LPAKRLSIETQTLHAELLERLGVVEAQRSIGNLEGTFSTKTIAGKQYLYFQHYTPGGGRRNLSLGLKSPKLDEVVLQYREGRREQATDPLRIRELCAQLKAGQIAVVPYSTARVIRELAECSVFKVGGVLVGTYAFGCIGNLLGVIWDRTTLGTQDVDIAAERIVSIAVPDVVADIPKALESLSMGFFPIPQLNPKHPSTSFSIRNNPLRVDLITPSAGRKEEPIYIPRLKAAAQPLKYLDYLIEDAIPGVVINGGAVPVLIPQPMRFAIHKLVVSRMRPATSAAKAQKDIYQAYQILSFFHEEHSHELAEAWKDLLSLGGSFIKMANDGIEAINRMIPNSQRQLDLEFFKVGGGQTKSDE
jgi:hypothetical protein